ncbi:MAG: tetratricopeptide repeat protein, partial [Opitutaceae bacterium]|nr:tetratricopeptide repeat protein [Opitutaceae bacterium]
MKYILKIAVVFFLLWSGASSVFAQSAGDQWKALNQEVLQLYQAGEYDRAIVVAEKALAIVEKNVGPDHLGVAASLNTLALPYQKQGQYEQAELLYKRTLA